MYWTLQNLKDSENKQSILHYGSIFSAATVLPELLEKVRVIDNTLLIVTHKYNNTKSHAPYGRFASSVACRM
jgi:ATP adenylyltransferase/5',5'''-P-1,P-4-tetraphosphate phosphorylase II